VAVFESDLGSLSPHGFGFNGTSDGYKYMKDMFNKYIKKGMITDFVENDGAMVDDGVLSQMGVPAFRNLVNETVDD